MAFRVLNRKRVQLQPRGRRFGAVNRAFSFDGARLLAAGSLVDVRGPEQAGAETQRPQIEQGDRKDAGGDEQAGPFAPGWGDRPAEPVVIGQVHGGDGDGGEQQRRRHAGPAHRWMPASSPDEDATHHHGDGDAYDEQGDLRQQRNWEAGPSLNAHHQGYEQIAEAPDDY